MSKNRKVLVGLATCLPFVALVIFYGAIFFMVFASMGSHHGKEPDIPGGWAAIGILALSTIVWVIVLLVGYIGHVYRNEQIEPGTKLLWTIVILFGNIFAMPIYWYIYVWREPA